MDPSPLRSAKAFVWALIFVCGWFAPAVSNGAETSFALQLNSFRIKANADRLVRKLQKEGYTTYTVETSSNDLWYKVRVGPYATREEAVQVKAALVESHKMQPIIVRTRNASAQNGAPVNKPQRVAKKPVVKKPAVIKPAFEGDEPEVLAMLEAEESPETPKAVAEAKPEPEAEQIAKVRPVPAIPVAEPKEQTAKQAPKPEKTAPEKTETARIEPPQAPAAVPANDDAENSIDVVLSQFLVWLQAWQKKQMDAYFSFYSNQFTGDGVAYKDWQKNRAQFLKQNNGIHVEVNDVIIQEKGDTIEMTFIESFKSDSFSDIRHKVLIWKKEGGQWKIVSESSKPA